MFTRCFSSLCRSLVWVGIFGCSLTYANELNPGSGASDPQQNAQVREIGSALLQAKRTYEPEEDAGLIRDQVDRVRQALKVLVEPLPPQQITAAPVQSVSSARTLSQSTNTATQWRQARQGQIADLEGALAKLNYVSSEIRAKRQASNSGVLQRLSARVLGTPLDNELGNPVITSVSGRVLERLQTLEEEVETALAATPKDRTQRLNHLVKRLEFVKHPVDSALKVQDERPTYITRTRHR